MKSNRNPLEAQSVRRQFAAAESASRAGDFQRSTQVLERMLEQDPQHLPGLELLARNQWRLGDYTKLIRTMQRLLVINPYEPGYHALLGSGLQSLGRYGEASQAYSRAMQIPGCIEALSDLQAWQSRLVQELYASDLVFRTRFRQNASRAVAERGLRLDVRNSGRLVLDRGDFALFTRPS